MDYLCLGAPNMVSFNPPLPEWKTEAIQRLGYGNLNKVGVQQESRGYTYRIQRLGYRNLNKVGVQQESGGYIGSRDLDKGT